MKIDPLLGVGPDNFCFTQLRTSMQVEVNRNAVDRPYNDWLYIAATRGIPSLLMHAALLVVCLVLAWKRRRVIGGWTVPAAGCAVLLYTAASMSGISVLTVAPMFWCLLGMLAADPLTEPVRTGKAEKGKDAKAEPAKEVKTENAKQAASAAGKAAAKKKSGKKKK